MTGLRSDFKHNEVLRIVCESVTTRNTRCKCGQVDEYLIEYILLWFAFITNDAMVEPDALLYNMYVHI